MRASAFVYAALMRERLLSIDTLRFMKDPSKINILSLEHICHKSSLHLTSFSFVVVFSFENVGRSFLLVIEMFGTIEETTANERRNVSIIP